MQPGRNEPCSCGSGKKFKKCCLLKQEPPADLLWRRLRSVNDELVHRLTEHAIREFGEDSLTEAWEEFWLWDEEQEAFDPVSDKNQLFGPFYLYNWYREEGDDQPLASPLNRTIAKDYLRVRGRGLPDLERRFIEASIEAPFSFHEVLEVIPGRELILRDVFLGTGVTVTEKLASEAAQVGDLFFGKVVKVDHVAMICGCGWIVIPPSRKLPILDLRKKVRQAVPGKKINFETLHEFDMELRELFLDLQEALLAPPRHCNTDGDLLAFHRITFEVPSAQLAFDALKSLSLMLSEKEMLEDAIRGPDGALRRLKIDWHKRGNKAHKHWDNTVLGHLEIEGTKLTIEVNSEKRAKKIKAEIKKRMGMLAVHKGTVLQSPESMLREHKAARDLGETLPDDREQEDLMNSPEVQAQIREMMAVHWENWYREKIPALGNRTPLQAAKDPDGRTLGARSILFSS